MTLTTWNVPSEAEPELYDQGEAPKQRRAKTDFQQRDGWKRKARSLDREVLTARPTDVFPDPTREQLTAAAAVFSEYERPPEAVPPPSATRQWQTEAWGFFDQVGEFSAAADLYGACFSRCSLVAAISNAKGLVQTTFDDEAPEKDVIAHNQEILSGLVAPYGGQAYLMHRVGLNLVVSGECFLYLNDEDDGHPGTWEILSTDELRPISSNSAQPAKDAQQVRWMRYYGPGFMPRYLPQSAYLCRIWVPHPRYSRHAWSSVLALLEILDEIVLLTREVRGETVSRLSSAGVFAVADEIDFPSDEDAESDTEAQDPFSRDLIDHMMTPITDKNSAAAVVPFIIRAPADLIERGLKHLSFARPDAAVALAKRTEAVIRFAQGFTWPPEVTLGHRETTFTNAGQISEDMFRLYIEPKLVTACDALTSGYLHPKLKQEAGINPAAPTPPEILKQRVWYDATKLVAHPDRSKLAKDLHDAIIISDASYRREAGGFTDDDAPNEDEVSERILLAQELHTSKTIRVTDTGIAPPVNPNLLEPDVQPGADPKHPLPLPVNPPAGAPQNLDPQGNPIAGPPPAPIPPAPVPPPIGREPAVHSVGIFAWRLHAAAEVTVERAVGRALGRLRNLAQQKPALAEQLVGVDNSNVAIALGPTTVRELAAERDLFAAELAPFTRTVMAWAREHGCEEPGLVAADVTEHAERVCRARLYDPTQPVALAKLSLIVERSLEPVSV